MNKEIKHILFGLLISLTLISGAFVFTNENQFAIVPNEKGVFPTSLSKIAKNFTPIKEAEAILQCDTGCYYDYNVKNCVCDAQDGGGCNEYYPECDDPRVNDYCLVGSMVSYHTNASYILWNCTNCAGTQSCSIPKTTAGSCGSSAYTCNAGTIANTHNISFGYAWDCLGLNGGTTANCTLYVPTAGVCNGTVGVCDVGTPTGVVNNFCNSSWSCTGVYGGTTTACPVFSRARAAGACGSSINTCDNANATMTDQTDTSANNLWNCSGTCGGPGTDCSYPKTNGTCGSSLWSCNAGVISAQSSDTNYNYWRCLGQFNGSDSGTCTYPTTNGVCGGSTYSCSSGSPVNQSNNGTYYTWNCNGANNGSNSGQCTYHMPVDGSCSGSHFNCNSGDPVNANTGASWWTWNCAGRYGGASSGQCSEIIPVAGVCHPTSDNTCLVGSWVNSTTDGNYDYWYCNGFYGGANSSQCSYLLTPTVYSVTPHTAYGGTTGNGYAGEAGTLTWAATSYPTACNIYKNGSYYTQVSGGTTSFTTEGLAAGDTTWGVACGNATGWSGVSNVTFRSVEPIPSQSGSCPNPGNVASYSWTLPSRAIGVYFRVDDNTTNPGTYADNIDGTSRTLSSIAGHAYTWWVHARDAYGNWSAPTYGNYSCAKNAACNNGSINGCSTDSTFSDLADDGNYNYWQCLGIGGGANSGTCSYPKVNPTCGGSINTCNPQYTFSDTGDDSVNYNWQCIGQSGGSTVNCTYPKPPVVSLSSATAYGGGGSTAAYEGESVTLSWTASNSPSSCTIYRNGSLLTGVSGGTTSYGAPAVSAGNTTFTVYCSNGGGTGTSNTITIWVPAPLTNVTATCPAPGTTAYFSWSLPSGTVGAYFRLYTDDLSGQVCAGLNPPLGDCSSPGGTSYTMATTPNKTYNGWIHSRGPVGNHSGSVGIPAVFCTPNVPAVSVSMSTGNGGSSGSAYAGESGTLNWTASNSPTSCSIYQNGGLLTTVSGGTTSYGVPGLGEGNTTYRVDCSNAGGTGTGNTVTFKVPTAPSNMSVSCPAPGTTANFSWTLPSGITSTYFRYYKTPPASIDYTTACTLGHTPPDGSCINVDASSVSQATNYNTNYYWYIHSRDAYGNWSAAYGGSFYCTPPAPATPSISGPTLGSVGASYNYNFSATDPAGMQVKYQVDWNNDGTPDITTSLGNSGWTYTGTNSWGGAGGKTFAARTVASDGRTSGWATYNVTINNIPIVAFNAASTVIDYNTQGAITWTSSYATGGCNVTKAGNAWQSGTSGSSVATGVLTTDTTFDIYCSNGVDVTHYAETIRLRPIITIIPTPSTVAYNSASSIYWSSVYASSCSVTKAGSAWMTGTSNAGASSGALLSTTAFNLTCTAANGNTNSQSTTVTVQPLNGACSGTVNTCTSGNFQEVTDTAAAQLWNCTGANGGTTANCSILNPPVAPTITGPTDGAKDTNYNFNITGVDNAGYQVKYGLDWDNDGIQDGVTVLGASGWSYVWTNNWGGGGAKYFKARTITSDGRTSGWSSVYTMNIHDIPVVSFTLVNSPTSYNTSSVVSWTSSDSTSCSVTKAGSAWQTGLTGSAVSTGALTADTTFVLTCNGAGGTNSTSAVVYVRPSVTFTATPTNIAYNAATTISWSSVYAASCNILKGGAAWLTGVSNAGVTSGPLTASTLFQIDCSSAAGTVKSATSFVTVAPLNGACNAGHYICNAGTSANNINGAMKWTWDCNGANGGTNAACEETKPDPSVPVITGPTTGKINTNYTFGFTATNPSGDPIRYAIDWDNSGTVDGYLPVSGTTAQGTTLNWTNQWAGSGTKTFKVRTETNGGPVSTWVSYNIDLYGLPVITWTPSSASVVYGGRLTFGYSATDATYCNLYATLTDDWNTYEGTPYISGGATTNTWTSVGPYYKNFKRKAVCYNPFGEYASAEIPITVLQNAATCGTITAPEYLLPGQTFNPVITMNNTGTNVWTNGSPLKHRIYTSISNWSTQYLPITNGPIGTGQLGNFTGSVTAPATEGLYDFTWRVIEDLEGGGTDSFGSVCTPTTSNGSKIVVKNPTLGVGDTDTDVDLLAFPTNYVAEDPAVTKTLTIRNRGGGNVTGNVTIPAGLFSCVSGCSFNIGPGGTSVATISFQSSATGTFGEYATITSDAGTKTVNLTGKTGDKFTVVTSPVNFGQVATTRSKFLTLTITNNSVVQTSSAFAISPTAPFYCVSGCASAAVGPGATRTVRLKFNPTIENASSITQDLVLPTTPSITISLVGQGVKPTFKVEEK